MSVLGTQVLDETDRDAHLPESWSCWRLGLRKGPRDAWFQSPCFPSQFHALKYSASAHSWVQSAVVFGKPEELGRTGTLRLENRADAVQWPHGARVWRKAQGDLGQAGVSSRPCRGPPALMRELSRSVDLSWEALLKSPLWTPSWDSRVLNCLIFAAGIQAWISTICDMCPWYKNHNFQFPVGLDVLHEGEDEVVWRFDKKSEQTSWGCWWWWWY